MGILWEIIQTGFMYDQRQKSNTIEDRVRDLEVHLEMTQNAMRKLTKKIEQIHGLDIDGDGQIG